MEVVVVVVSFVTLFWLFVIEFDFGMGMDIGIDCGDFCYGV